MVGTDVGHSVPTPLGPPTYFFLYLFAFDLLTFQIPVQPARPFTTSQESVFIFMSGHVFLHTRFTPGSYAHSEAFPSQCFQGHP